MNIKNAPEEEDLIVLKPGLQKVEMLPETKLQNAASFLIRLEDHTLGNLLWQQLLTDPSVLYAG